MKATNRWLKNRYFSLFCLFTVFSLIVQLIGPRPVNVTASTNQPSQTEVVGIGNQKSNYDQLRPSLQSKTPNIGKRHSFSEPHFRVDVFQDTDFITQKLIPVQSKQKVYSTLFFVENVGQFDSKQAFELRQNSSISRFTDDSIWFSLIEPQKSEIEEGELSISNDGLPIDQANDKENTQKGVNIQVKFIGSENKPIIEGFIRSESKISYFKGNDENNWRPDVPVWNGIRYVDLYPGVDLEVSGIDGSWSWTLVVKDSIKLVDWINKKKGNDIHFQINGTKTNRYSNKNMQLTSEIGELFLPDINIIWKDGNPLGIEELSPMLDGKELVLISNDQFLEFLSTPTPTSEPTSTETLLPTNTIVAETATLQPTASETLLPTETEILIERTPTLEPTTTETSLPIEPIQLETPTLEPTATETQLPTETEIPTGDPTLTEPTIIKTTIPTPSETPTVSTIVFGTPTTVIPSTETPNPTLTVIPTEEILPSLETGPTFEETYTWNFTTDNVLELTSALSQSIQGRIYATYLGGLSVVRDTYIDPEGFVYVVGNGNSPGFPTTPGAFKESSTGITDAFVSKINPEGSALVYSTFLGGSNEDQTLSITVNSSGLAYVAGWTSSNNFPTTPGVYQPANQPSSSLYDAFVTKLNNNGTGLVYSTYLGGSGSGDQIWDLTIDSDGHAYVVGMSSGTGFPTTPGAYDAESTDYYEGFVAKLSSNASTLMFSSFLGGSGAECVQAYERKDCSIFIDSARNVYVVGNTWSSDFPTTSNAYDQTYNGSVDAFLTKFNSAGSNLLYSTYLGGSGTESYGTFLGAIDSFGAVYIAGTTSSADFPITSGNYHGGRDVFLIKLFPDSRGVIYSTLIGGTNNDTVRGLDITPNGDVYIAGETYSSNFPVSLNAFQPSLRGDKDAFLTKVGPDGSTIQYSTYLGGNSGEVGYAVSRSDNTSVSIAGYTSSYDFPTTAGSFQPTGPGNESFVAVFSLESQVQDNNTYSSCGPSKNAGTSSSAFSECPTTQESQGSAGDPINTRTGSFDVSFSDISIPTVAGNLVFQRYYSSGAIYLSTQSFGPGWTHNLDTRLIFPSDPGGNPDGILFKAHSLNTYLFVDNEDGTFGPEAGLTSNLVMQVGPPITYTITDQSQHVYSFDEYGKLTLWEDGKGHSWSYSYDINDRLYRVTDTTSSNYLELSYSTGGNLSSVTDSFGRSVSYDYDPSNDLELVTDISNQVWVLTYDSNHRFRILTDPGNKTIIHTEYDSQGRAYQQFDGDNNLVLEITFNADGSRVITDGEGNDTTHFYSTRNTLYLDRNSLDSTKLKDYDDNFRLVSQTDENSNALALNWSSDGANLLKITDAEGNETDLFYDPLNNLESITLPSGVSNDYGYTGTLLTSSSDGLNQTTHFTYTDISDAPAPVGLLKTIEDPLNHLTQFGYNSLGQLTNKINALNLETQFVYDSWGNVKATINPYGRQDWSCYNASGQLVKTIINASGGWDNWAIEPCSDQYFPVDEPSVDRTIRYFYDLSGNQFASIGEDGQISRTYFDQNNRIAFTVENLSGHSMENPIPPSFNPTYPDRNIRTDYAYDNNGNLIATTDTLGIISRTYFDSENRPEYVVQNLTGQAIGVSTPPLYNPLYPDENIITQMVYDLAGNLIASIDTHGIITRTYFDHVNRPISVVRNLTGQSIIGSTPPSFNPNYPDQNVRTDTVYDASGNVIATIDTLGRITRTYFTALDQPGTIIQNLVGQSIATSTPPTYNPIYPDQNLRTDFYYDAAGNQVAIIDPNGIITRTYYDALNRPTVVVQNLQGQSIDVIYPPTYNPLYPDQNVRSETVYDLYGQVIASIDPNGVISRIYLDGLGRTSSVVRNLTGQSIESPFPPTYDPAYTDQNVRSDVLYDTWGNSIAQTFNDGMILRAYYYGGRRIVGLVENLSNWWVGHLLMPAYDPNYPDQNVRTLTSYNGLGNVVSTTDPNGKVTFSCYDDIGRVIKTVQNPSIGTPCVEYTPSIQSDQDIIKKNVYDALSNLTQSRDPLGKLTSFAYDDLGRLLSVTDPLLHQTSYTHDGLGNQVFNTDAENVVTKYEYNAINQLTAVVENYISGTSADAQTNVRTEYTYDANGNMLSIKNARNQYTYFTYDALNRLKTETDPLNHMTTYNYDAIGNQVSKVDANGLTTVFSYDALSRPDNVDNPDSDPDIVYTYNDAGLFDTMTDGLGSTQWTYDGLGRIINLVDPNNHSIAYEYDAIGNRKSLTYPDLKQVSYSYDLAGRLNSATSWDSSITSYQYDRRGQLDLVTLPNSLSTDYTFNDAGYLTQKVNSVNSTPLSSFGYSYDNVGNRVSASETTVLAVPTPVSDVLFVDSFESADMSKWNRNKSDLGDLSVATQAAMTGTYGLKAVIDDNTSIYVMDWSPRNETRYKTSFKFDMNTISMTLDDAHYLLYAYDASGGGMLRVEFQKARKGYQVRAESLKDSGWNSTSWYTISDAPHTIQVEWKAATSSSTHNGTLQLWIDGVSQQLVTKVDNDTVRLDSVKLGVVEGVDVGTRGTEYFDDFNSWRSQAWTVGETVSRTITYDYDPLYRLTSASSSDGDLFQYTYDAVGNRLSETTIGNVTLNYVYDNANRLSSVEGVSYTWDDNGNLLSNGVTAYTYNHANQLTGISQGGTNYSYAYNGMGHRLRQTVGTSTTNYVIDNSSGLSQVLADGANTYLYGLDRISQSNTGGKDYFLGDALGSVRQMANTSGGITLSRNYEPYGTTYGAMGSKSSSYGFTSEWADGTGLVNLRARYYAPASGRFISPDVWFGAITTPQSLHKWVYVENNPISNLDPTGYIKENQNEINEASLHLSFLEAEYQVKLEKDWGYFIIPSQVNSCRWNEGYWTIEEIRKVLIAVIKLGANMGSPQKFISNTGGIFIDQRDIGAYSGLTSPHYISYTNASRSFTEWTVMHELAHAWDANFNSNLSKQMEMFTGGHTSLQESNKLKESGYCTDKDWEQGCNDAGYFFGGRPSKGSNSGFNRREDFAESVTTYFYPNDALAFISKFMVEDYTNAYRYYDYKIETRWQFVKGLFNGTIKP